MSDPKGLSMIVPCFNEAESINKTIEELDISLKRSGMKYEIIVVDDGSTDRTRKNASLYDSSNVVVVGYDDNRGKGDAIKYGCSYVTGDIVAFMDADTDLCPSHLEGFIRTMHDKKADVVVGSKLHPDSSVDYPLFRRILSHGYRYFNKLLFNLNVRDTQVGQKLFRKEVLDDIMPRVLVKRYAFDLELLVNAQHLGYKIVEAPIKLDYDFSGSSVNIRAVWKIFVDTCAIFYRLRILKYYDREGTGKKKSRFYALT
ncbi:MAG: glycosyltransferase [Candidatus Aminicenantes bacterium]|nr:glycosyltransferase [Candidatus Aminicenantes bacterium]